MENKFKLLKQFGKFTIEKFDNRYLIADTKSYDGNCLWLTEYEFFKLSENMQEIVNKSKETT